MTKGVSATTDDEGTARDESDDSGVSVSESSRRRQRGKHKNKDKKGRTD